MRTKRVRRRPPAERIPYLSHGFSLFLVRVAHAGLSFLTFFMVGFIWGREEQGLFALFIAAALIGGLVLGMGLPTAILYHVARGETKSWVAREASWTLGFLWFVLLGAPYLLFTSLHPEWLTALLETVLGYSSYTLLGILIACACLLATWEGQAATRMAMGDMARYNQLVLVRAVISFFLVCVVLVSLPAPSEGDPSVRVWAPLAWMAGLFLATLLATVERRVGHPVAYAKTFSFLRMALPYGAATAAASLNILLLLRLDHFMLFMLLPHSRPARLVGIYALTTLAAEIPRLFSGAVATLLVSQTASDHLAGRESQTPLVARIVFIVMIGVLPFLTLVYWFAQEILFMRGEDYSAGWPVFWILYGGSICLGLDDIFSSHLLGKKRPHWNTRVSGAMLAANVFLNLWWIPRWGIVGAAAATTVAYAGGMLLTGGLVLWESRISPWQLLPRPYDLVRMLDLFSSRPETRGRT